MSKLFWKAVINDVQNTACAPYEVEALLDSFEYTMKTMATTLARKAWYDLADYGTAKQSGIDGFTLMLERIKVLDTYQWVGNFENGNKKLEVIGMLEKD
ncbi:hypothetical protein [Bartonella sp. HY761]|uniref:hypothetical protein n=1 Tax=Bartonella sp. HY761 TaxID=2979330 RepID=UPI00220652B7|nr:hypothetical protein [Bartonella sp. HY761]UXN07499.1 hypothetical protein N6A79_05815 [Bartonella sp. HY761]